MDKHLVVELLERACIFLRMLRDFPGGPVVKISPSNAGGAGSIPGRGTKIPTCWKKKKKLIPIGKPFSTIVLLIYVPKAICVCPYPDTFANKGILIFQGYQGQKVPGSSCWVWNIGGPTGPQVP